MLHQDNILSVLTNSQQNICDDCLVSAAGLKIRQQANIRNRTLASKGLITREHGICSICQKMKLINRSVGKDKQHTIQHQPTKKPVEKASLPATSDTEHWYWEGNVQSALITWLVHNGYQIVSAADTKSREHGKDIIAKDTEGNLLWISAKGYPTPKPSRISQARHWFAQALFDLILYRQEDASVRLALVLPDGFQTYQSLAKRVEWLKSVTPFMIFWVSETGNVRLV